MSRSSSRTRQTARTGLFIVQQSGQIRIFKNGSLLPAAFLNVAGVPNFTAGGGEQGLLGLAFDPDYATNRFFYVTYTTTTGAPVFKYTTTLARYRASASNADLADPASRTLILSIPKKYVNHNGGMIAFGPDTFLYMSMGDGGSGGDPDNNGQNIHTLLGKILRLDVHSTPPGWQDLRHTLHKSIFRKCRPVRPPGDLGLWPAQPLAFLL